MTDDTKNKLPTPNINSYESAADVSHQQTRARAEVENGVCLDSPTPVQILKFCVSVSGLVILPLDTKQEKAEGLRRWRKDEQSGWMLLRP